MASQTFKRYFYEGMPDSMTGANWEKWALGFAHHLDGLRDATKASVKAKYPTEAAAQSDTTALGLIGDDRQIERYSGETDAQYAERLRTAWTKYTDAGIETAITDDLTGMGFGGITVMEYKDWPAGAAPNEYESPGDNFDVNGDPWWSRFWVFIETYNGATISSAAAWAAAAWGAAPWGTTLDPGAIAGSLKAITKWKPAHALAVYVCFLLDGAVFADCWAGGTWGSATWGSVAGTGKAALVYINE